MREKRLSLLVSSLLLVALSPAHADDARIAALEARIAALEAQLRAAAPAAPVSAPAPTPGATAAAAPEPIQQTTLTPSAVPGTKFFVSGFVKLDAMSTHTGDGELADGGIARDLYVPGLIPIGGRSEASDIDSHLKFSRLIFGTDGVSNGHSVQTRIEADFFGNGLGDERFNNASGLVVRHAFVNVDNRWLFGQTWTTFMDAATLPESTDLIGPTDGTVFVREPQVRYTHGPWMFALENPETTLTPRGGGARISTDDSSVPDLVVRYNGKIGTGTFGVAGLLRQLRFEADGRSDDTVGAGISVFGKVPIGSDDVRFAVTAGQGISRYLALNANNDGVLNARGEIDTVDGVFGYVAYRHLFTPALRGSVFYARGEYDSPVGGGLLQTRSTQSFHVNLFYSPLPKWDIGAELFYADREIESGASGDLWRLHTTVKYAF